MCITSWKCRWNCISHHIQYYTYMQQYCFQSCLQNMKQNQKWNKISSSFVTSWHTHTLIYVHIVQIYFKKSIMKAIKYYTYPIKIDSKSHRRFLITDNSNDLTNWSTEGEIKQQQGLSCMIAWLIIVTLSS